MRLLVGFLAVVFAFGALAAIADASAAYEVGIWIAGTHYEKGIHTPLYSLSVGDPMKYEEELARKSPAMGFSSRAAFQGTVYVRYHKNRRFWFSRTCRRPITGKEIERWQYERVKGLPSSFCKDSKPGQPQRVLPKPFNKLAVSELGLVEYVIGYNDNAIRLYFKALTTSNQVKSFLTAVGKHYPVHITDRTKQNLQPAVP